MPSKIGPLSAVIPQVIDNMAKLRDKEGHKNSLTAKNDLIKKMKKLMKKRKKRKK